MKSIRVTLWFSSMHGMSRPIILKSHDERMVE